MYENKDGIKGCYHQQYERSQKGPDEHEKALADLCDDLPALVWYILFAYYPMAGLQLAFKHYNARLGIWGSHWTGLTNFKLLFADTNFWQAVGRTLHINLMKLVICFPAPVILAILFNELRIGKESDVVCVNIIFSKQSFSDNINI